MSKFKKNPSVILGVCVTVLFLALGFIRVDFLDALEYMFYDVKMNMRGDSNPSDEIVIVDIDDDSLKKLGSWPWPRSTIARGINKIDKAEPGVIGVTIVYGEPSKDPALKEFNLLAELIPKTGKQNREFHESLEQAKLRLDHDGKLEQAFEKSGKIILPVYFKNSLVKDKEKPPPILYKEAVRIENPDGIEINPWDEISMPIPRFLETAKGIGHINTVKDVDAKVRREKLLIPYQDLFMPSFALKIAASRMGVSKKSIKAVVGSHVELGSHKIPMNNNNELLINFKKYGGSERPFQRFSFYDILYDKIPPDLLKGRIVLVGLSAAGIDPTISVPTAKTIAAVEYNANAVWSILNKKNIEKPSWDFYVWLVLTLLIGVFIIFLLPRLKAVFAFTAFAILAAILIIVPTYIFVSKGLWIQATYPFLQLVVGSFGVVLLNLFVTEKKTEKVEGESAETNRMLGLSFQSQGMLDMAFDKFRKVPVNDEMKEVLYNLAQDFERKRQYNKAVSVYEHIGEADSSYKDVNERMEKLATAAETMAYGDGLLGSGSGPGDPLLTVSAGTRPTLGRYEVIRQLGKGAMGIVYLGQDPRINRTTAIKTFKFSEDFEAEEAEKMKVKFFREAESAGTLSHPNIVTIYDAGEEQELAYIAMEYLEGEDLSGYTKAKKLIPMRKVLDHIADIADALNYAHKMGVVHRDIKPANIMLLKSGIVKVTDFGIARITATSQTQTGIVKGTPHYMSPEQISGVKVDGRSDIFSLGVMMFQLLTGRLPFKGETPAALMHQIMNKEHPDPKRFNPKLSKAHATIINKALEKDREKRYQEASQMAAHLRKLGEKIDALMAKRNQAG